ncbi:MAG: hypothetical protein HQK61_02375 [Desulfamplus sp.]|nr:hypothetical protein [Desulfamplus sp.]
MNFNGKIIMLFFMARKFQSQNNRSRSSCVPARTFQSGIDCSEAFHVPVRVVMLSLVFILIATTLFTGCSITQQPSYINSTETNEALKVLQQIKSINKEIKTCKGSGWITIADTQQTTKFRMAWAASFPDKIRLTLLSAGHPVETILADGKTVTFISHTGKHNTKKVNSKNPSLKEVVSIPVKMQDILSIFAGRVPVGKFDIATIAQVTDSAQSTDTMLILKKRWNGESQNIVIGPQNKILGFSLIDEHRKLIHSVFNQQYKNFDSFSIPAKVKVRDNEGRAIDFEITSYQPNIQIRPDMFVLTESR